MISLLLKRTAAAVSLYLILATAHICAQIPGRCGEPDFRTRGRTFLVIDAGNALPVEGRTRFVQGDRVMVIIRNKNPYHYAYRIGSSTAPLPGLILSEMLVPVIGDFSELRKSQHEGITACTPGERPGAGVISRIEATTRDIDQQLESLRRKIHGAIQQHDEFLKMISGERVYCERAMSDGRKLLTVLEELINPESMVTELERVGERINTLDAMHGELLKSMDSSSPECRQSVLDKRLRESARIRENAGLLLDALRKIIARRSSFIDLATVISSVNESSFTDVIEPFSDGEPGQRVIEIYRRDLMVKNSPEIKLGEVSIDVRAARIVSFSAGIGFSSLDDAIFTRQTSVVHGSAGDSLATVIGYERNSHGAPSIVGLLNFHILRFDAPALGDISAGFSIGTVLNAGLAGRDGEYIGGISLATSDDRLILTFASHWGRVNELAGGLSVGQVVPSNLAEIPTRSEYKGVFMLAVSGRIY